MRQKSPSVVSGLRLLLLAFVMAIFIVPGCATAQPGTLGALMGKRTDGRLFIRGVPAGQGADRAGIQVDDEIVAIDGKPVKDLPEDDIRRAVRGDVGSTVTLTIERGGQRREVKVERSPILAAPPPVKGSSAP